MPNHEHTIKAFEDNHALRNLRKNSVCLRHEVLSFAPEDTDKLNHEKIHTLARKYLELTYTNNLAFGQIHYDQDHFHIHIMVSPNEYKSRSVLHVNNEKYRQVRLDLERFQKEHFPELEKSIVFIKQKDRSKDKSNTPHKEKQLAQRLGKESTIKDVLKEQLANCYNKSAGKEEFFSYILQLDGVEIYDYRGKSSGITYKNKKYRFSLLGISKEHFTKLSDIDRKQVLERMKRLNNVIEQDQQIELNR